MKIVRLVVTAVSLFLSASLYASCLEQGPKDNLGGFPEGTIVHTKYGTAPIQSIRVNDPVLTFDIKTGKTTANRVTHVLSFAAEEVAYVKVGRNEFMVNPDHRFYLSGSGEWVAARDLKAGEHEVMDRLGKPRSVAAVKIVKGKTTLYELTVETTSNFYVGREGILVHNFVMMIPVATWVIGEGLAWAAASSIAASVAAAAIYDTCQNIATVAKRKGDLSEIDYIADTHNIDRRDFGKWVEGEKGREGRGGRDNLSKDRLHDLAEEYKIFRGNKPRR